MNVGKPEHGREALLTAIVEGSPYAKILVNDRGRIALVNEQTEKLFGYARDEMLGESIEMLVPERFRRGHPELRNSFMEAPVARPMGAGRDLYGRRKDGSEVPIEIGLNPISTETGTFTLAAISDITERKRNDELRVIQLGIEQHAAELDALNRELERASQFKSQFVSTMSHELRTPLNAIIGAAELLGRTDLNERARLHAQTIAEAADALLAIVNSVLDFSKIEAGKMEFKQAPFLVDAVVEGAADVAAQLAGDKPLTIHTYVDPDIPPVQGDADRLRQILLNLLGNAVKFTERGRVVARAQIAGSTGETLTLRFEVEDTGIGIPADVVPELFQPFVQADASASRRHGGTGLGLSICRRLVELMGGEIGVKSEPGHGSLFWLTAVFPCAGGLHAMQRRTCGGTAALVVSADETFVEIVGRYTASWGIPMRRAARPADVFAALQSSSGDGWIAVVDLDDVRDPQLAWTIDAVRATIPGRVITIGGGGPIRKPMRQSYLFDAIVKASGEAPAPANPLEASGSPDAVIPAGTPILVAEDNTRLQRVLKLQFDELGLPAEFVSDGTQALEAVREGKYAMVFMDCQMPNLDGFAATRAIRAEERETGRHIPIAAMTANAFAEDRDACLAAGMDDYLAKPVKLTDLRAMVERWAHRTVPEAGCD